MIYNSWTEDLQTVDMQFDFSADNAAKKALYKIALNRNNPDSVLAVDFNGSLLEGTDLDKISEELVKMGGKQYFSVLNADWKNKLFSWDDTFLSFSMDQDMYVTLYSLNPERFEKLKSFMRPIVVPPSISGKVYVLVSATGGPKFKSIGTASLPLELDNYAEEVADNTKHIIKDLETDSPCGRMVIFDGEPGTGKTYLVRGLLSEIKNAMFVLIPPDLVGELTNPNLVKTIVENHETLGGPTIFIIEDADKCLATRGPDNLHILTNLLNLSDGIVGSLCDIRIICTTNAKFDDIEEAIMRPGRLCRRVHIGELTFAKACVIYKRLTGKDATFKDSKYTLAEVYRYARQDGWEPKKIDTSKIVGFRRDSLPDWDE